MAPDAQDLPEPELVEIERRSVAMLSPGQWALRRERAAELLEQLSWALRELRRLRRLLEPPRRPPTTDWLRRLASADDRELATVAAAARADGVPDAAIEAVLRGRRRPTPRAGG